MTSTSYFSLPSQVVQAGQTKMLYRGKMPGLTRLTVHSETAGELPPLYETPPATVPGFAYRTARPIAFRGALELRLVSRDVTRISWIDFPMNEAVEFSAEFGEIWATLDQEYAVGVPNPNMRVSCAISHANGACPQTARYTHFIRQPIVPPPAPLSSYNIAIQPAAKAAHIYAAQYNYALRLTDGQVQAYNLVSGVTKVFMAQQISSSDFPILTVPLSQPMTCLSLSDVLDVPGPSVVAFPGCVVFDVAP